MCAVDEYVKENVPITDDESSDGVIPMPIMSSK